MWHCQGKQLIYTSHASPDHNRIHTSLVFAAGLLITGTDEGELVVWGEEPISYVGHQEMITCLAAINKGEDFIRIASGS